MIDSGKGNNASILLKVILDGEMRKKILITLGIIIIYRAAIFMPLPGINLESLRIFLEAIAKSQGQGLFGITLLFNEGVAGRFTIFALGLMPFISACIIMQLLTAVIPFFKKIYIEDQAGRKRINKFTYCLTAILSLVQAFFIGSWLENASIFQGFHMVVYPGWSFRLLTVISLTAGVFLLLWLANLINNYGIGNGVAILALSGLLSKFIIIVYQFIYLGRHSDYIGNTFIPLLLILSISVVAIWLITKAEKKISVVYADSGIKNSITLRFTWAGRIPKDFAHSIILFPATIASFNPMFSKFAVQGDLLYMALVFALTIFFTYFYTAILFKPQSIINKMNKYGCRIENMKSDNEAAGYLDMAVTKYTLISALFLIAASILPDIYTRVFRLPYLITSFIGGISIVIIVGVFYDLKCQIKSYFAMKEIDSKSKWAVVYIASDEIEAEIRKGFLETRGIACVVEPLRFTWGMPIKTIVDQYRLYVVNAKKEEAKRLLV